MIGIYNTITIDNVEYIRPTNLTLEREDVYAGEYRTCTGAVIADRIGWRYADATLSWDMLTDAKLTALAALNGPVTLAFTDSDGAKSETVIRLGFANTPTRHTDNAGQVIWKDVAVVLRFIDVHND